ncbi:MAG: hypothetical protein ACTSSH_10885 [Candidatus Heimdallarchaeota archaeon]
MTKGSDRKYKIIVIIGSILIALTLTSGLIFGPFNEILPDALREKLGYSSDNEGEITVRLIINFNGFKENVNTTIFFETNKGATAYSILEATNLTLKIRSYPNGIYLEGIDSIEENSEYSWWYLADGVDGGGAANRFDLRTNNVKIITWIYKTI